MAGSGAALSVENAVVVVIYSPIFFGNRIHPLTVRRLCRGRFIGHGQVSALLTSDQVARHMFVNQAPPADCAYISTQLQHIIMILVTTHRKIVSVKRDIYNSVYWVSCIFTSLNGAYYPLFSRDWFALTGWASAE